MFIQYIFRVHLYIALSFLSRSYDWAFPKMPPQPIIYPILAKWSPQVFLPHIYQCIAVTRIFLGHEVKGLKMYPFVYAEDVDLLLGIYECMNNIYYLENIS
jgi:hypothetical protein